MCFAFTDIYPRDLIELELERRAPRALGLSRREPTGTDGG